MSVPKSQRNQSQVEFFQKAILIKKAMIMFFIKDMKVKDADKSFNIFSSKMRETDKKTFEKLCQEYKITFQMEYPAWLIIHFRDRIIKICNDLCDNITSAYVIYSTFLSDSIQRRIYMNNAIINCEQLLKEVAFIKETFPNCKINELSLVIDDIVKEIELLKQWRKKDNNELKKLFQNANNIEKTVNCEVLKCSINEIFGEN